MMPEWELENDLVGLTDKDNIIWEKLEDGRLGFRSTDQGYPFVIEMRKVGAVLLAEGLGVESLISRGVIFGNLWRAVRRQEDRNKIDSEFKELLDSYGKDNGR